MKKLVFFFGIVVVIGCKKVEDCICWKFCGEDVILIIFFENMDWFIFKLCLNYEFIQDLINVIVLKGGKNLLNLVKVFIGDDGVIEIGNENKCGFL